MNLNPYLSFKGNCEEALNFYKDVFGGELDISLYKGSPMEDKVSEDFKDKVLHGRLTTDEFVIMASDISDHDVTCGNNIHLNIDFSSEDVQTKVFDKMSLDSNVIMPLADQFWGARFGMLTDKFETSWMFNFLKVPSAS